MTMTMTMTMKKLRELRDESMAADRRLRMADEVAAIAAHNAKRAVAWAASAQADCDAAAAALDAAEIAYAARSASTRGAL